MLLGTYRLQDPAGKELAALVHGNRLIRANVRSTDELRRAWSTPAFKDALRRRNINPQLVLADPENTALLDQYLQEQDAVPQGDPPRTADEGAQAEGVDNGLEGSPLRVRIPLKRWREQIVADEMFNNKRARTEAPSDSDAVLSEA
jgi:hypothetical protein